jgi:hypothetical protein
VRVSTVLLFLAIELAACGQLSPDRSQPNFRIFIDTIGGEHTSLDADPATEKLARGVGQGATAGGSTGVAVAAMCGPYFLFCLPFTAGAGSVIGGGVGATAGFAGLPEETAKNLNADLAEIDDRRDFRKELIEEVVAVIPENDQASQAEADVRATIRIHRIETVQYRKNNISFLMMASLQVDQLGRNERLPWERRKRDDRHYYRCSTPKRGAEDWLNDEQATIDKALTTCINTISESISTMLMRVIHG